MERGELRNGQAMPMIFWASRKPVKYAPWTLAQLSGLVASPAKNSRLFTLQADGVGILLPKHMREVEVQLVHQARIQPIDGFLLGMCKSG